MYTLTLSDHHSKGIATRHEADMMVSQLYDLLRSPVISRLTVAQLTKLIGAKCIQLTRNWQRKKATKLFNLSSSKSDII